VRADQRRVAQRRKNVVVVGQVVVAVQVHHPPGCTQRNPESPLGGMYGPAVDIGIQYGAFPMTSTYRPWQRRFPPQAPRAEYFGAGPGWLRKHGPVANGS
jgi:hypothetical protein